MNEMEEIKYAGYNLLAEFFSCREMGNYPVGDMECRNRICWEVVLKKNKKQPVFLT